MIFQVLAQTRGEWNPPGLQGLLDILSAISPLPLLPPTGPLLSSKAYKAGHEKHLREKQSGVRLGERRSFASPLVQVKGIGPKTANVTDIHRSLHLPHNPDTYGSPKSPVINSYEPQMTQKTDSYGSPEAPLKNSYEPPVTSILSYGSPDSSLANSYEFYPGSVIDSYGAPKPPVSNSYASQKGSVKDSYGAQKSPLINSYESQKGSEEDSYGAPKSPLINSYQSSSLTPVTSKESPASLSKVPVQNSYKQSSTQETDTYGSPKGSLINTNEPTNQGSGSYEAALTNSYISVDLKATMPVSIAQSTDPKSEAFYGTPKVAAINAHKLVSAHTALKDLVGTLESKQPHATETSGPQISPSISKTDLNVEIASPKYPPGYLRGKPGPKVYNGHPCHKKEADPRCKRANHPSEVRPSKHHTQHKSKHGRPRKYGKKPPNKKHLKQKPRKLGQKRPKAGPPKLVKVYWNSVNGVKTAQTKRQPVRKPPQRKKKQRPRSKHHHKVQKGEAKVKNKPGAYQPPPVIEPTMLGFYPLSPSIAANSVPTYPPEEFVW